MTKTGSPEICDYEGSDYRTEFWKGTGRDYEDRVERIAIRRLLPPRGERLLDIGAGFGRYTSEFKGYRQVVLLDYSRSQLEFARQKYGDDGFVYVAANVYQMPFAPGIFDAAVMIRVLHHMSEPPAALRAIREIMQKDGVFVLEFANKRNAKAILRWILRRQEWNPFDRDPVEFVKLNYDFHPRNVSDALLSANFRPGRTLTVSHFRVDFLKRLIPTGILVALDAFFQSTGQMWQLTPSVFIRSAASGPDASGPAGAFWRCPICRSFDLDEQEDVLLCQGCGKRWDKRNGIYDFKGSTQK